MKTPDILRDFGLGWLDASGPHADIVLSTRVRLARNLQGHRYATQADAGDREAVYSAVAGMVDTPVIPAGFRLLRMGELDAHTRRIFLERRLVSSELLSRKRAEEPTAGAALLVCHGDPVTIMVNEEDHLRLQSLVSGLSVMQAWSMVDRLDDGIGRDLSLAYHPEFGFLTSCPTNTGTGLRASALVHLPALVLTKEITRVLEGLDRVGLTHRGLYGEGSDFVGNFFQVSNQKTLGRSEEDLVEHFGNTVATVIEKERRARQVLRGAGPRTEDLIWRAYGLLRHARLLTYRDLMELLSGVRLGVSLGMLPSPRVSALNRIIIFAQAAHLAEAAGRELDASERQAHRAQYVRRVLEGENGSPTTDTGS
ncbi:MAG: ATP--guanido phosphotransferase [Gemmatimonadota bacterium]|nr:ATP--guanido phosphotransferase [Gemmatimonadota bacterium]